MEVLVCGQPQLFVFLNNDIPPSCDRQTGSVALGSPDSALIFKKKLM